MIRAHWKWWLGPAVLLLGLGAVLGSCGSRAYRATADAEAVLARLESDINSPVSSPFSDFESLRQRVDSALSSIQFARRNYRPVGWFSPLLRFTPRYGGDMAEGSRLVAYVEHTLQAVSLASESAGRLAETMRTDGSIEDMLTAGAEAFGREQAVFLEALEQLQDAQEIRGEIAGDRLSAGNRERLRRIDSLAKSLDSLLVAGAEGAARITRLLDATDALKSGRENLQDLSETLSGDEILSLGPRALSEHRDSVQSLAASAGELASAWDGLSALLWLPIGLDGLDPAAVESGLESLRRLLYVYVGMLDEAEGIWSAAENGLFTDRFGQPFGISLVEIERLATEGLTEVRGLEHLSDALAPLDSGLLTEEILASQERALAQLVGRAQLFRELLGYNGERIYLVLGQDRNELRPTGGFLGVVWEAQFENGVLEDRRFLTSPAVDIDVPLERWLPSPASLLTSMWAGFLPFRDANWWPDFPTSAEALAHIYERSQRRDVDGILAFNQQLASDLVRTLGPLEAAGELVTVENIDELFVQGVETVVETDDIGSRKAFALHFGNALIEHIQSGVDAETGGNVARAVFDSLASGEMLLWARAPAQQRRITTLGWDGGLARTVEDYVMLVDANVFAPKTSRQIRWALEYETTLSLVRVQHSRVKVTAANTAPWYGEETRCRQPSWSENWPPCYWSYLRLYLPADGEVLHAQSLPMPEGSLAYRYGDVTGDTVSTGFSEGNEDRRKLIVGGLIAIPPGDAVSYEVEYEPRVDLSVDEDGTISYRLVLQHQPGMVAFPVRIRLHHPRAWRLERSSEVPIDTELGTTEFVVELAEDTVLEALFAVE